MEIDDDILPEAEAIVIACRAPQPVEK